MEIKMIREGTPNSGKLLRVITPDGRGVKVSLYEWDTEANKWFEWGAYTYFATAADAIDWWSAFGFVVVEGEN